MMLDISRGDHLSSVVMTMLTDQVTGLEALLDLEELEAEPQIDEKCPQCHQPFSAWACSYAHGRARVERGLHFDGRPA